MKIIPLHCEYLTSSKFHCLVTDDYAKVIKWINKKYNCDYKDEENSNTYGSTFELNHPINGIAIIIWLRETVTPFEMLYNAMHECGHACFKMMKYCGVDADNNDGEHYLYLQEFLTNQVVDKLSKNKNKQKLANKKPLTKGKKKSKIKS